MSLRGNCFKSYSELACINDVIFLKVVCSGLFYFADIDDEAIDSRAEVKSFDKNKLKHVDTKEENTLPGAGGHLSSIP